MTYLEGFRVCKNWATQNFGRGKFSASCHFPLGDFLFHNKPGSRTVAMISWRLLDACWYFLEAS